jgi:hypothetical protein
LVGQAARLAAHNGSARLIEEFRATYGHLRPWSNSRAVRDLDDELLDYGLA